MSASFRQWLAEHARRGRVVEVNRWALQTHLRGAERVLPLVAANLPPDRAARATWAFAQLKDALEGREAVSQPAAEPGRVL